MIALRTSLVLLLALAGCLAEPPDPDWAPSFGAADPEDLQPLPYSSLAIGVWSGGEVARYGSWYGHSTALVIEELPASDHPLVASTYDNIWVFGAGDLVAGIDRYNHELRWSRVLEEPVKALAASDYGRTLVHFGTTLQGWSFGSGEILWSLDLNSFDDIPERNAVVMDYDRAWLLGDPVQAISSSDGAILTVSPASTPGAHLAILRGSQLVVAFDGGLRGLNYQSLEAEWTYETSSPVASLLPGGNGAICLTEDGELLRIDSEGYLQGFWSDGSAWRSPAYMNGRVALTDGERLAVLRASDFGNHIVSPPTSRPISTISSAGYERFVGGLDSGFVLWEVQQAGAADDDDSDEFGTIDELDVDLPGAPLILMDTDEY